MQPKRTALRAWLGLVAASLGLYLGALDLTVNVALPAITSSFAIDMTSVQWIIVAYVGTTMGLQLVAGRLADQRGLKRYFCAGVVVYTVAMACIGLAPTFRSLLAFRLLQAVGYAAIAATAPALVAHLFEAARRGRALGVMTGISTLGMITATLGGGFLIDALGWNAIFLARIPIGLAALVLAVVVLPEFKSAPENGERVDWLGAVLLFIAIAATVLFMNLGGRIGWADVTVVGLALTGIVAGFVFIGVEQHATAPILRLDIFTPNVKRALASAFLMSFATFVNLFILPFFVTDVIGATAAVLGVLLTLTPIASTAAAPLAGWAADHFEPRWVASAALFVVTLGMLLLARLDPGFDNNRRRGGSRRFRRGDGCVSVEQHDQHAGSATGGTLRIR